MWPWRVHDTTPYLVQGNVIKMNKARGAPSKGFIFTWRLLFSIWDRLLNCRRVIIYNANTCKGPICIFCFQRGGEGFWLVVKRTPLLFPSTLSHWRRYSKVIINFASGALETWKLFILNASSFQFLYNLYFLFYLLLFVCWISSWVWETLLCGSFRIWKSTLRGTSKSFVTRALQLSMEKLFMLFDEPT